MDQEQINRNVIHANNVVKVAEQLVTASKEGDRKRMEIAIDRITNLLQYLSQFRRS
jgi:ribosomal protein L17